MRPFPWARSLLAATCLLSSPAAWAEGPTVEELLAKGDEYDTKDKPAEAMKYYGPAEKAEPKNVKILTRIARQYRHLMEETPGKEEKLRLGYKSLEYAQRAAALGISDSEAQLSIAISYGKMMPLLGSKEQIDASPRVKRSVDAALALDPRNDLAWHILGRWHRVLAEVGSLKRAVAGAIYGKLPVGSFEEAVKALEKAIAINPRRAIHYIELGRVFAQMGREAEARTFLTKGLALPTDDHDDLEAKERGREALKKLR